MKEKIIKGIIEFFLIVFSVLLAFYLEDMRQRANEKKELVTKLKQLRSSLIVDSSAFAGKFKFLAQADSLIQMELKRIIKKENARVVLTGFFNTRFYFPIRNWSLKKMLEDDSFNMLSGNLKEALYSYDFDRNFPDEAVENAIYEKDKEMEMYVHQNLKYNFKLGSSQNVEYAVKDSAVLYSEELKSYFVKKIQEVNWVRDYLKNLPQKAHETAIQIDKELKELE